MVFTSREYYFFYYPIAHKGKLVKAQTYSCEIKNLQKTIFYRFLQGHTLGCLCATIWFQYIYEDIISKKNISDSIIKVGIPYSIFFGVVL